MIQGKCAYYQMDTDMIALTLPQPTSHYDMMLNSSYQVYWTHTNAKFPLEYLQFTIH